MHKVQETESDAGLENAIRQSWSAGSKVKILSAITGAWTTAHIVTIHKDWLYCLLEDGDTKKIDRYDGHVQPHDTSGDDGEDDEELFWMKDSSFTSTPSGDTNIVPSGQSLSLGFETLRTIGNDFNSSKIVENSLLSPRTQHRESMKQVKNIGNALTLEEKQFQKMCGYTIWVQWCDSQELHGYYQCVGLRNNRYHFKHRKDPLAELFADDKGYWYLMYDGKMLYKSKRKGHEDPPPRNWKCIEGSLPPPGVSQVALPDDATPMVIYDEEQKKEQQRRDTIDDEDGKEDDTMSQMSGVSRQTTVKHTGLMSPKEATTKHSKKKSKNKRKSKSSKKKNKLNMEKLLMDEFEVAIDVLDFNFDGSKQVAFHLNIARYMEVTKVKKDGQAEQLGVLQGDILLKINDEDISKNWEKATNLLRSFVQKKEQFTITFVRRKVENLLITVVRAGNSEYNGKYKFYKRDPEDDECPIYVKNDHDEDFDFTGIESNTSSKDDPLTSNSESIHIIQRVYSNPENSEALWVLKNGKDEHFYMCVTNEYLPPQHGWELVPDSPANYPAPGLQFTSTQSKFDHVNRLRGYSTAEKSAADQSRMEMENQDDIKASEDALKSNVHDALNVNNRNRTNKHRHEKTLTRMRATLGSANEFNNAAKGQQQRSHTGGVSGYMPSKPGMGYQAQFGRQKGGGFGSKIFGAKRPKRPQPSNMTATSIKSKSDGNESAPETDEDTAKIEAIWKQKLEATTKKAINQLTTKHQEEISKKEETVDNLNVIVTNLRNNLSESNEWYYQLYLEKCELSLILQEKQIEVTQSKSKQKEMGKRYFEQQQRSQELESKLNEISKTFSSRMSAIQSQPKTHRPTKSTVSDLSNIEQQFRALLKSESSTSPATMMSDDDDGRGRNEYLENELIKLNEKMNQTNEKYVLLKQENKKLKSDNKSLQNQLSSKKDGVDQFYQERTNKLTAKVSLFQQNIYNLMSLLQNVEQEYMQKIGKLPKVTKAIDWRNEYDPKNVSKRIAAANDTNAKHPHNQTFVVNEKQNGKHHKKKSKKTKKSKHKPDNESATHSMHLPDDERWSGFNLGGAGDEDEDISYHKKQQSKSKPKHRGNKNNESRIIDL